MDLSPYVESVRTGVANASSLADEHTQQVAARLGGAIESSTRLALIQALSDAAATISADLAPSSVELRMSGQEPEFAVIVHGTDQQPTLLLPDAGPENDPAGDEPDAEIDDEPVARVTLRLPQSVKSKVDDRATAEGISTNAWLIRVVMDALVDDPGRGGWWPPRRPGPPDAPSLLRTERALRPARGLRSQRTLRPGRPHRPVGRSARRRAAFPRERPGVGPLTSANSVYEGVRHVVIDNFGGGSITIEPGIARSGRGGFVDQCRG